MDFHSIISAAKQNVSGTDKRNDKYYKTKFDAPKKTIKERKLTHGIQKFLEKQKLEEEEKIRKAREKKMELLARRDPKEQRKIEKHLKVVKSSKKFFTGDKTLDENTEITLQNDFSLPDQDDYDYESKTSDLFYQKLMEQYHKMPQDDKFSKSNSIKKSNKSETRDENGEIHLKNGHRQRVSKIAGTSESSSTKKKSAPSTSSTNAPSSAEKKPPPPAEKPKPKIRAAPIVNFEQLLKLAEQKQHEDIVINVPTKKEPERLLTSKEKKEQEELEAARKFKHKGDNGTARIPKLGAIPRLGDSSKQDKNNNSSDKDKLSQKMQSGSDIKNSSRFNDTDRNKSQTKSSQSSGSKLRDALIKPERSSNSSPTTSKLSNSQKPQVPQTSKQPLNGCSLKSSKNNSGNSKMSPPSTSNGRPDKSRLPATKEPAKSMKEPLRAREFPPKDLIKSREFPPRDLKKTREFPPRDMKRPLSHQQIARKRRVIEDEDSEYDSELDDFIDDGDDEDNSYSNEIQKIFGYDKSRYRDEDFDDREMESDYRTVMKEEYISKKIGLMEDLEDMKMEAEQNRMKELMRKKRRKV